MPIASINPATGETLEVFESHDDDEVDRRLAQAADAARTLRQTSFTDRTTWMYQAAELLESQQGQAARMMTLEMGKPIVQARQEVAKCVHGMRFYANNAAPFLASEPLIDPGVVGAKDAWTVWEPMGVVLAVMPWNFPLWQVMRFAAPALMAGNAAVLKHASNVPRSALFLEALFEGAGFPGGSFRTLLIGSDQVDWVLKDSRVSAATLTGSEAAGRAVAATAGAQVKKTVLELGGSDPFVVMQSADLEQAVKVAVKARVQNNGQSCIAAKRFIVADAVYDDFVSRFTDTMASLVVGDPLDEATDVGPLATESGRGDLVELVEDALSKGAEVLTGGTAPDGRGWYYPPTVLSGLTADMRLVTEEAFGPVASVYRVADRDEAVRVANQTPFGLSSAIWSTDPEEQEFFVQHLEAGMVFVNGMSESYPELPFGGVKNSGYGRELTYAGIREFCNLKTVWRA